jgi:hypothetical protein
MNNNVHVLCPCCGTEIEIGNGNAQVSNGELPDGVYTLIPKNDQKLNALKDMGIDITKFFSSFSGGTSSTSGNNTSVGSFASGSAGRGSESVSSERDEIAEGIMSEGYIEGKNLFRRWIMAQMMRALASGDYQAYYKNYPYIYSWKVVADEFKAQAKIKDAEELAIRKTFFNAKVVLEMLYHYEKKAKSYLKHATRTKVKNVEGNTKTFINIPYCGAFDLDKRDEFIQEIINYRNQVKQNAENPEMLAKVVAEIHKFVKGYSSQNNRVRLPLETYKCNDFRDAFMAAGAYYTLDNMIKFHNCVIYNNDFIHNYTGYGDFSNAPFTKTESLKVLNAFKDKYRGNGEAYFIFKLLKDTIKANNYSIDW